MRHIYFSLFALFFFMSCGTIGHVQFYNFNLPKADVEKELRAIIESSEYAIPSKWSDIYAESRPLEFFYVYFKKSPEEVYQVGFTNKETWKSSSTCRLSLDGIYNGDRWQYRSKLSYADMRRIRERFETDILYKMKYPYNKDD